MLIFLKCSGILGFLWWFAHLLSLKDGFDHKSLPLVITVEECCQWYVMEVGLLPTSQYVTRFRRACP